MVAKIVTKGRCLRLRPCNAEEMPSPATLVAGRRDRVETTAGREGRLHALQPPLGTAGGSVELRLGVLMHDPFGLLVRVGMMIVVIHTSHISTWRRSGYLYQTGKPYCAGPTMTRRRLVVIETWRTSEVDGRRGWAAWMGWLVFGGRVKSRHWKSDR
jgi:hypothetical protein